MHLSFMRRAILSYSIRNRRRKAEMFSEWMRKHECATVLFVGAMGDEHAGIPVMANAGIVERILSKSFNVVMGINIEPAETSYPFQIADARELPFPNGFVDLALANAIIEHVGQEADQRRMVEEMTRVSRCWIITTPNRLFPIESHTSALLLHWSRRWRQDRKEFTRLLSISEFRALLPPTAMVKGRPWSPTFSAFYDSASVERLR